MLDLTKARAMELIAELDDEVENLIEELGKNRVEITKMYLTDPAKLDSTLLNKLVTLSAYVGLVNEINYTPVEKEYWRPKDYVDVMIPGLYKWLEGGDAKHYMDEALRLLREGLVEPQDQDMLFSSVLAAGILTDKNNEQQGK